MRGSITEYVNEVAAFRPVMPKVFPFHCIAYLPGVNAKGEPNTARLTTLDANKEDAADHLDAACKAIFGNVPCSEVMEGDGK